MLAIATPLPQFFDLDGLPLDQGFVYVGRPNQNPQTAPLQVYWDEDGTIPAAQPLRTLNGLIARNGTPSNAFVAGNYSLEVLRKNMAQVLYAPNSINTGLQSQIGYKRSEAGAVAATLASKLGESLSVLDFGAVADCTDYNVGTDNQPAFQAAIDAANKIGAEVIVPPGKYRIGAPGLLISNTTGGKLESLRASIRGAGPRGSMLLGDSGNFDLLTVKGEPGNLGSYSQQHIDEIAILKADVQGSCIYLDNHYHFSMRNVRTNGGRYGVFMFDVHESNFINCVFTFALYGFYANHNVFTQPNVLSFYNCSIGNCRNHAIDVHNPATFTYIGGSIEGSQPIPGASPEPDAVRWGCRLIWDDAVGEGTGGATFIGTYFEQNDGKADLWFSNPGVASTLSLVGCSFQRHTIHTTNCIFFEGNGEAHYTLSLMGNGFRGYTEYGYVTSADQKYVAIADTTRNIKVVDLGNNYFHEVERPNFSAFGPHVEQLGVATAWVSTSNTTGTVAKSFGVSTVVRTGVGLYTINYARPLTTGSNAYSITLLAGVSGYGTVVNETPTSVQISIKTFSNVALDSRFSVLVFGGNDIAG